MRTSLLTALFLSALAFGCTTATKGGAGPDGGTPTGEGGTAASTALTCGGIFDCAVKCEEAGAPCDEACLAKGSPAASDAVNGLVTCSNANSCADAACIQTNCQTEVNACVRSSTSGGGTPLEGAAPAGNIPPELVAVWKGNEETIELRADGTVGRSLRVRAATCSYTGIENGTAVADGTTLTLYLTTGSFVDCTGPSDTPYKPTTEVFTYTITEHSASTALRLEKVNCAAGGNCSNGYDKH